MTKINDNNLFKLSGKLMLIAVSTSLLTNKIADTSQQKVVKIGGPIILFEIIIGLWLLLKGIKIPSKDEGIRA